MNYIAHRLLVASLITSQVSGMQAPTPVNRDIALIDTVLKITDNSVLHAEGNALKRRWTEFWTINPGAQQRDLTFESQLCARIKRDATLQGMLKRLLIGSLQSQFDYLKEINLARMFDLPDVDDLRLEHVRKATDLLIFVERDQFYGVAKFENTLSKSEESRYRTLHRDTANFVFRVYQLAFLDELAQSDSKTRESATEKIDAQIKLIKSSPFNADFLKHIIVVTYPTKTVEVK